MFSGPLINTLHLLKMLNSCISVLLRAGRCDINAVELSFKQEGLVFKRLSQELVNESSSTAKLYVHIS